MRNYLRKYLTFNKVGAMTGNKILPMVLLLAIVVMSGCGKGGGSGTGIGGGSGNGSGSGSGDTTAPTVSSTIPANSATSVSLNGKIAATFSEAMAPATITTSTFTLTQGGTSVAGTVAYVGTTATFKPTSNLTASTVYVGTITTGAQDTDGNALASNNTWSFTTGTTTDTTAPTVSSTNPANSDTGVAPNGKISTTFSKGMDPATITTSTFTLTQGGTPIAGAVTYVGTTATFTPTSNLAASTVYVGTITTGVTDLAGNALASNNTWSFTTGTTTDTTAPTVSSTNPADTDTGVAINGSTSATFSEAMDPATINTSTFTLTHSGTSVAGAVTYAGTTATFKPTSNLAVSTSYTATITTGAKDLAGNALAVAKTWSFTTGAASALGPGAVNLGTAGSFAILSKSGISTTGVTAITGDIGVSPIDHTALTGFSETMDSSGTFSTSIYVVGGGKLYAADYTPPTPAKMTTAVDDMQIAYTDAAGRTTPDFVNLGAGNLSGLILAPGLYKWGTGVSTDNTGFTISGGANDTWIFQISGTLVVANGAIVTLAGGAQTKNIFWQVTGQTTLGTTSQFKGIILDRTAVVVQHGATENGRAYAQTAVTLDADTVTP